MMTVRQLIDGLGGVVAVARARGVNRQAVYQWISADAVPAQQLVPIWQMALGAGLDWTPPGAEALRDKLRAAPAAEGVAA